jgi:4-amino-4-deoxy-L-arabinose transferase-like glycosyltransferase
MEGIRPRPESEWPRMSEQTSQFASLSNALARLRTHWLGAPLLLQVLEAALIVRVLAADVVQWYVQRQGIPRVCLFPDAEYYWSLARSIRSGSLYEIVEWGDIPHFALRTPGYPLFVAACQAILGEHPLGVRLVQAGLGAGTVWLVYRLTREVVGRHEQEPGTGSRSKGERTTRRGWSVPLAAAALTAFHPYFIVMSVLILSEAVFVPLMLAALWGLAALWNEAAVSPRGNRRTLLIAFGVGTASGAAVLTRPSWALFVLVMLGAWVFARGAGRGRLVPAIRLLMMALIGIVLVMGPWWVRNARIYGRFVPTAVWMGASLYDGLNPGATGASDMSFLEAPDIWPLDELDQDAELTRRALAFARANPGRVLRLAVVKLERYWSPWPNAEGFRSPVLAAPSAVVVVPLLAFLAIGLWSRRRDSRVWILLAGPMLYFCALHMVFASSMRYRIPGEVPAMGLAAIGIHRVVGERRAL